MSDADTLQTAHLIDETGPTTTAAELCTFKLEKPDDPGGECGLVLRVDRLFVPYLNRQLRTTCQYAYAD